MWPEGTALHDLRDGEYWVLCSAVCYFAIPSVSRLHGVNDRMTSEHRAEFCCLHNHRCENLKSYE
jgi:hypothetical protein